MTNYTVIFSSDNELGKKTLMATLEYAVENGLKLVGLRQDDKVMPYVLLANLIMKYGSLTGVKGWDQLNEKMKRMLLKLYFMTDRCEDFSIEEHTVIRKLIQRGLVKLVIPVNSVQFCHYELSTEGYSVILRVMNKYAQSINKG